MALPSAALSAMGLTVDLVGSLLLAFDLWRPHPPHELPEIPSPEALLVQVIEACEAPEDIRPLALRRAREACCRCEKERALRGTASGARLRRTGRIGLILICLGFFGQLVGTIVSSILAAQPPP
jgi:hypothetical protein